MRRRLAVLAACSIPALGLAACGGSAHGGGGAASTPGVTASTGSGTAPSAAPSSPQAELKAAAAVLDRTRSYHFEDRAVDADGPGTLSGDVRQDGSLAAILRQNGTTIALRVVDGAMFLRANRPFWRMHGGVRAAGLLADHWVTGVPYGRASLDALRPKELAHCLTRDHGTVRRRGEATVAGRRVRVYQDLGDKPGTAPGLVSIAADGVPRLLRTQQTGPKRPGGHRDPRCDPDSKPSTTTREDLRVSRYDAAAPIVKPRGAIDLARLHKGSGGPTSTS